MTVNLIYSITNHTITNDEGTILVPSYACYSGNNLIGPDKNNVKSIATHDHGPLPLGLYYIGTWEMHPELGPNSAALTPDPKNNMYGRGGFYLHGPGGNDPANCSKGCIIVLHSFRLALSALKPSQILVIQ